MDAATIHESNRLRVSLGMKPLPIPGAQPPQVAESAAASDSDGEAASTLESRQAQAQDNYRSYMENNLMKKRREAKAAAVRKAREAAQRFTLLEGTGLGEANEGGDLDTKSWLKGHKKRRKTIEIAKKYEEEVAEAEAAAAKTVRYTSKDLAGVKVAHDASAFLEGSHQILTLKDATIEENEEEGDELENINLREDEKLADRLELKKKRPAYDPYDEQDGKRGILSQYDEEIEGKKTKNFSLDSNGAMSELSDLLRLPVRRTSNMKNVNVDDIIGDAPVSSDYLAPSDIKIRKPKKKKERTLRQRHSDTDSLISPDFIKADANAMDVGNGQSTGLKRKSDAHLFVDDDLQAALAIQRMHALKSRRKSSMAEFVKRVKETPDEPDLPKEQTGGLIIGEVSEFISGLSQHHEDDDEVKARRKTRAVKRSQTSKTLGTDMVEDDPMSTNVEVMDGNGITQSKDVMVAASEQGSIFDQEKMVDSSLSETLALLRERGLLEDSRGDTSHKSQLERQEFLRKKRQLEEELDEKARQQRDRDRKSGKLDRMSRADREEYARQQNAWRDHQHSQRMAELISSAYKPSVELKYTDEHGRQLDSKEAFKHLSHQFHGKGSGKGKTEKKLKQIEDEKRRTAQSLFDASQGSGMNAATAQQLKKRKEAGVRLG